jgi:hypothetical protein
MLLEQPRVGRVPYSYRTLDCGCVRVQAIVLLARELRAAGSSREATAPTEAVKNPSAGATRQNHPTLFFIPERIMHMVDAPGAFDSSRV